MPGTLHVVATPIGNLEDITLRALRILREVSVIAAEDTRRTARLLQHHGISTPTISFHEHNTRGRIPQLISRLQDGQSIAVVSDAGTPGVSDPGLELVQACIEQGIAVDPVPGASAVMAALVASGFPTAPVTFLGFAPNRSTHRKKWLQELAALPHTVVFFESPHRIQQTLADAAVALGERPLAIAREITKIHQEFHRGSAAQLVDSPNLVRGELTIVVGPAKAEASMATDVPDDVHLADEFRQLTESGQLTRRQALAELSRKYATPSREIYAKLEAAKAAVP